MNNRLRWDQVVAAGVGTLVGGVVGGLLAGGEAPPGDGEDAAAAGPPAFSPATLDNLGVTVEKVRPTEFRRYLPVAAVVEPTPRTGQQVYTPIGGRVAGLEVRRGAVVATGEPVVRLLRAPLPRPELELTAELLRPAAESLHRTVVELRRAAEEVRITRTELERIEAYTGAVGGRDLPLVPRQRAIDLRYELARAERAVEQARAELQRHGLTGEQVDAVAAGGGLPPLDAARWRRALARNGLWPEPAARLHAALPPSRQAWPWTVATIGELAARGLATPELSDWLAETPEAGTHFLELAVLLLRGHTPTELRRLHALGAFAEVVEVPAPATPTGGGSWDVHDVLVEPGQEVERGTPLIALRDPGRLYLRMEPVGGEVEAVLHAVERDLAIAGSPLVPGSGPGLEDLHVAFVHGAGEGGGGSTAAFIEVDNRPIHEAREGDRLVARTWALRTGLQYVLRVPVEVLEDVYVLPATAIAEHGADQVVFLRDGNDFKPVPVPIAFRDDRVAVVPVTGNTALFPGDPVVHTGAFELSLALQAREGGGGHGHPHGH